MTKNFTIGTSRIKITKCKQKLIVWNQNNQINEASMKTFIVEGALSRRAENTDLEVKLVGVGRKAAVWRKTDREEDSKRE